MDQVFREKENNNFLRAGYNKEVPLLACADSMGRDRVMTPI